MRPYEILEQGFRRICRGRVVQIPGKLSGFGPRNGLWERKSALSHTNISGLQCVLVLSTRICVFSNTLSFDNLSERELRKRLSNQAGVHPLLRLG